LVTVTKRGDGGEFIPKGAIAGRRAIAALRRGSSVHRVSNATEFLLTAGRLLQRRQSEPGREIAPGRKPLGRWHSAVIAVEAIGPTPGIVINRRAVRFDFERWLISASNARSAAKVS
jgi:hypothetical protein